MSNYPYPYNSSRIQYGYLECKWRVRDFEQHRFYLLPSTQKSIYMLSNFYVTFLDISYPNKLQAWRNVWAWAIFSTQPNGGVDEENFLSIILIKLSFHFHDNKKSTFYTLYLIIFLSSGVSLHKVMWSCQVGGDR